MVMIDQVCWNEMNVDDELTIQCGDDECCGYEWMLRAKLYRWRHFPVDHVVDPFITVGKAVGGMGLGVGAKDEIAVSDPTNSVVGHHYDNQFQTEADLDKIKEPEVTHNVEETERRLALAHEIFDGILGVKLVGVGPPSLAIWDRVAEWMSVEAAPYAIIDQPDLIHSLVARIATCLRQSARPARRAGVAVRPAGLDSLYRRLHRRSTRRGIQPRQAARKRPVGHGHGPDVRNSLPRHVQGVRSRSRRPALRPLRRAAGSADGIGESTTG